MIQIVGLIVLVYVVARSFAEIFATPDGRISRSGRIVYGVCLVVEVGLGALLLTSGTLSEPLPIPTPMLR